MPKTLLVLIALLSAVLAWAASTNSPDGKPGYKDTPVLPGQPWHVHDPDRPVPHVVTPGETFSHGALPPADAMVLFDGKDLSKWIGASNSPAKWKVENGYMEAFKGAGSIHTKDEFGDFQLHLEFAEPETVKGDSQGRGNSGIKIYGLYEVQVLDSYNNPTYPDGQAGALYGQWPPLVNASKKPGEWQSYEIIFETPRWDESGKLIKRGNVTVIHNGVVLHHKKEFLGETLHRELGTYDKHHPPHGPIELQEHGNPVRYRNLWIRNLGEYDQP